MPLLTVFSERFQQDNKVICLIIAIQKTLLDRSIRMLEAQKKSITISFFWTLFSVMNVYHTTKISFHSVLEEQCINSFFVATTTLEWSATLEDSCFVSTLDL